MPNTLSRILSFCALAKPISKIMKHYAQRTKVKQTGCICLFSSEKVTHTNLTIEYEVFVRPTEECMSNGRVYYKNLLFMESEI